MPKNLIIGTICALAMLIASGSASAASLRISPAGAITAASLGNVTFSNELISVGCSLVMRGTLSRGPIEETAGAQLGEVTAAAASECTGGSVVFLQLPWRITYSSGPAGGLVLEIREFRYVQPNFGGFINCLYSGALRSTLTTTGSNPYITGLLRLDATVAMRLNSGSGSGCWEEEFLRGTLSFTTQTLTVI